MRQLIDYREEQDKSNKALADRAADSAAFEERERAAAAEKAKSQEGFRAASALLNKDAEEEHKAEMEWAQEEIDTAKVIADAKISEEERVAKAREEAIALQERAVSERIASENLYFDAASNMQSAIVDLSTKTYDTTTEAGKKAAERQWKIQHALQ